MKKLIIFVLVLGAIFIVVLNTGWVADQAISWVKEHPQDPNAPAVYYRTGRWVDFMGDDDRACDLYSRLCQEYPLEAEFCAPALYYTARDKAHKSNIETIKRRALPYLDTLFNQYASQDEWVTKGKLLQTEVENGL